MSAIAIFVKTPGLSPVKTRLADAIGPEWAMELYRLCADAMLSIAKAAEIGPVYWAVAESIPAAAGHWQPRAPVLHQGDGSLGERMCRVMNVLVDQHGSGILLGADSPQFEIEPLREAANWLSSESRRSVIGPARDGGFWTFGSNHCIEEKHWTRVTYSRPDTFRQFEHSMKNEADWLELPRLTDLDTVTDLGVLHSELKCLDHPLPAQSRLIRALSAMQSTNLNPRNKTSHA
ncbi:glycosyltransferase [Wenzhouxiangella sp. AB-CW3]|uniref:TIGR04282 family arsenosugar biosynthesis glycosyltransferase n=1 Tax=Wenzhouxiangella sp. AB-CW3 TaxID=2771012 RepID=UPI00168B2B79|nr:TIGR04282 family arsenosugar biosynthesis glycosyltransferase [Wenzhouxiangella sp. AB-CW3]QOC21447.1 glycosyltransferase [Wenzhouxiangella sp. AB-CW3]